jgi:hypothetical protein
MNDRQPGFMIGGITRSAILLSQQNPARALP